MSHSKPPHDRYIPEYFREPSSGNQTPLSPSTAGEGNPQTDTDEPRARTQDPVQPTATDERCPSPNTQCDPERYVVEDSHEDGSVGPDKIDMLRVKAEKDPPLREELIRLAQYLQEYRPGLLDSTDEIGSIEHEAGQDWQFRRRLLELIRLLDSKSILRRNGHWVVHCPQGDRRASAPSSIDVPPSSMPAQPRTILPPATGPVDPLSESSSAAKQVQAEESADSLQVEPASEPDSEAKQSQAEENPQPPRSSETGSPTRQVSDKEFASDSGIQLVSQPGQTHPAPQRGGGGDVRKRKRDPSPPTASKLSTDPRQTCPRPVSLSNDPFSDPSAPAPSAHSASTPEAMGMVDRCTREPQQEEPDYTSFPEPAPSETSNQPASNVGDEAKASVSTSMRPQGPRPESLRKKQPPDHSVQTDLPSGFSEGGLISVPDTPTHPRWGTSPGPIEGSQGSGNAGRDGQSGANGSNASHSSHRSSFESPPDGVRRYSRPIKVQSPEPEAKGPPHYAPPRTTPPPRWDPPQPNDRSASPPPPQLFTGRLTRVNASGERGQSNATQLWALPISMCAYCHGAIEEGYFSRLQIPPPVRVIDGVPDAHPERRIDRGGRAAQPTQVWVRTEIRQPFGPLTVICEVCNSWFHHRCVEAYKNQAKVDSRSGLMCPRCPEPWDPQS
ncbi:hypothetical protein ASPCAL14085 [Aspergillus calidoustus]|uniref:Uncharacterized protein n=1 Tax=Aspergillus calidoustus TaxID=454130 RepID=A0A0U5GF09_ASPCI|nr:hypothetical protein ASPCAL14085 [Aspergillus calidoustus]